MDPQRLNSAGSMFLTRPQLAHYTPTREELAWRAGEVYDAGRAHEDLQGRRPAASCCCSPDDLPLRGTTGL